MILEYAYKRVQPRQYKNMLGILVDLKHDIRNKIEYPQDQDYLRRVQNGDLGNIEKK